MLALPDASGKCSEVDHFHLGFRSLDGYAHERLGVSPRKARALLRL